MKQAVIASLTLAAVLALAAPAGAHCQIPCGIFHDELRVQLMEEHITTIEKSMNEIIALGKTEPVNYNQLVRWVMNKEDHVRQLDEIVGAYFLAQRIKLPAADADEQATKEYLHKLALLHAIQVHAMKAKQGTDLAEIATLRELVANFRLAYFGEAGGHSH
jgi:nickel superoxide dismutase